MSNIESFATGLTQAITGYMQQGQTQQRDLQTYAAQKQIDQQTKDTGDVTATPTYVTPDMIGGLFGQVSPEMGQAASKFVNDYNTKNPQQPLTWDQTTQGLSGILDKISSLQAKSSTYDDKQSQQQDKLEKQYSDKLTSVRGDQSLMRSEAQRDSAGLAYDTIAKAQSEGRDLSETEYTDVLGQLWKVRTGSSPTEQVLADLKQKTAKEGFNRAATYVTGNPNLVGATTDETLNNIKQFVVSSGQKADQQWSAYMGPRMTPPSTLEKSRVDHVNSQHRGLSFAEQKAVSDKTYPLKKKPVQPSGWRVVR